NKESCCSGAAGGKNTVKADTDSMAGKPECFSFRHHKTSGRSDPFGKNLLPVAIEGGREIQEFPAAQGAQAGIEVIEALVNQFERDDLSVEQVAERRVHTDIRSLSITTEPDLRKSQEVPGPLEEAARIQRDDFVRLPTKPVLKVRLFPLPFCIAKTARHCLASKDDTGICGEYEIGQSRHWRHPFQDHARILFEHL